MHERIGQDLRYPAKQEAANLVGTANRPSLDLCSNTDTRIELGPIDIQQSVLVISFDTDRNHDNERF
jgi:hypothetical protein